MNVANLKLCKELWELSGHTWLGDGDHKPEYKAAPAYDLGYLLRKLPSVVNRLYLSINWEGDSWFARYDLTGDPDEEHSVYQKANTPEDAACKLAIELFKQDMLHPTTQVERKDQ